jgi:hypothetical protein
MAELNAWAAKLSRQVTFDHACPEKERGSRYILESPLGTVLAFLKLFFLAKLLFTSHSL